jgi:exopolysaccharide biosynthesis polyprenyl glycosylphosphotransferase
MPKNKIHFEISERKALLYIFDVALAYASLSFFGSILELEYLNMAVGNSISAWSLLVYFTVFGTIFEIYNLQVASNQYQIVKALLLSVSVTVLVYLLTPFLSPVLPPNRLQILVFYSVLFCVLLLWRLFYLHFLASHRFVQKAILICNTAELPELINGLENVDPHYKIIAYVIADNQTDKAADLNGHLPIIEAENLTEFVQKNAVAEIVIASHCTQGMTPQLYQQLLRLLEKGKIIREYTQVYETKTNRIPVQYMARDFYRFFPFSRSNNNKLYLLVVRLLDVFFSLTGLSIALVILPFIVIGNTIANRGSLFYKQKRIGKDGAVFEILKFRTMVHAAETGTAVFATANDSRITTLGKFMRKTRIDELPQFINVLKGEMAVIGPRPERPEIVKQIAAMMPFYETRHIIKPGLTGWAQVNYSYGENIDDSLVKLQYDLYYIKHRSFYLDLNITLKTITTVIFYRGQ